MTKQRLVLEPDYAGAFPLWIYRGENDPDVPISDELRRALLAWGEEWEAASWNTYDDPNPPPRTPAQEEHFEAWRQRGQALAERVQSELGPEYEVLYEVDWQRELGET